FRGRRSPRVLHRNPTTQREPGPAATIRCVLFTTPVPRSHAMPHPYRIDDLDGSIAASAATLSRDVLARHASEVDASGRFPRESIDALSGAGLLGLTVPAAHGGR